jgi:hypothetical protein
VFGWVDWFGWCLIGLVGCLSPVTVVCGGFGAGFGGALVRCSPAKAGGRTENENVWFRNSSRNRHRPFILSNNFTKEAREGKTGWKEVKK